MEIFYPANQFINFYIVPLMIEYRDSAAVDALPGPPRSAIAATGEQVGHAMILRDITESRRSARQTLESERLNALTLLAARVAHATGHPPHPLHIRVHA